MTFPLAPAALVEISGSDARSFAQSQFTSDVLSLSRNAWQWSAWLDPMGRTRNVFALLQADDDRLLAWLPRGNATIMAGKLRPFVMRSKLRLEVLADYWLRGLDADDDEDAIRRSDDHAWILAMPGPAKRRALICRSPSAASVNAQQLAAWHYADVNAALPWISDEVSAEFTPAALGLERLGAVSLDKGCYPGQEIVARLHYRGGNKRACSRLRIFSETIPQAGDEIHAGADGPVLGRILHAAHVAGSAPEALAVLPLEIPDGSGLMLTDGSALERLAINP